MLGNLIVSSRSGRSVRGLSIAIMLGALVAILLPGAVGASPPAGRVSGRVGTPEMQYVRAGFTTQRVAPVRDELSLSPRGTGANIVATYTGFSNPAKAAFQRAINILKTRINSNMTIKVDARWSHLGGSSGILGGARATSDWLGPNNMVLPVALAEAKCNCNRNATQKEILAEFNADRSDWYFGTDGNTPNSKYDLVSVVLHELVHGVGFYGSFYVQGAQGGWGYTDGSPPPTYKDTYDAQVWSSVQQGKQLANPSNYPNPSAALKAQLTDGTVFFGNGNSNVVAVRGARAKLYAPSPWRPGSSIAHFDEAAFPTGTGHALMTPFLANGESHHTLSSLTKALLRDRGWTTN